MGAVLINKAVFLHIPKTGGNWIMEVLRRKKVIKRTWEEKHADYNRFLIIENELAKMKPFIFCFVRNPLTWYESWWKYMLMEPRQFRSWASRPFHPCTPLDGCGDDDFNKFVEKCIVKRPGFVSEMFSQFTKQAMFIGKQETLGLDLVEVFDRLKIKHNKQRISEIEPINISEQRQLKWDSSLKKEVEKLEYAAFKRYGYC